MVHRATTGRKAASVPCLIGCLVTLLWLVPISAGDADSIGSTRLPSVRLTGLDGADGSRLGSVSSRGGFQPPRLHVDLRPNRNFYDTHLMPELAYRMTGFRTLHGLPASAAEIDQSLIFSAAGQEARRNTIKGATDALKDYVLETTALNRVVASFDRRGRSTSAPDGTTPGAAPRTSDLGFSVGFAHRMPNFGLRYRLGTTVTRLELSGQGSVELQFERFDARRMRATVGLRYDAADDWYGLNYQVRF